MGTLTLRAQLLVALALLSAGPVLVLGVVQAKRAEDVETARVDRETLLAATSLSRELGRIIESHANVARSLAAEVAKEGTVDENVLGGRTERTLKNFPGLYGIFVLDRLGVTVEGTVSVDGTLRSTAGTSYSDRDWFHKILEGAPFASELLRSRTTHRPAVILLARILDSSSALLGIVGVGVDLDAVQGALERVGDAAPGLSAVVLEPSGRVVATTRNERAQPLEQLGSLPLYRAAEGAAPAARTGKDDQGVERRGTATSVESSVVKWSVTTSWAMTAIRRRRIHALLTVGVFALGALGLGLVVAALLARRLARPVARLSTWIEAIGRGDLRPAVNPHGRMPPRELVDLERAIAGMLGHLNAVVGQLGRTVNAVRGVTERLSRASAQMVLDSSAQREAVQKSSRAIVQITDSIATVGGSVRGLSATASQTSGSITSLDRQIHSIAASLQTLGEAISGAYLYVQNTEEQASAVATNTTQLGASVGKTSDSLVVLTDSIRVVAARADHARGLARQALGAAEAGRAAVQETIEATRGIQQRFSAITEAVRLLVGRSEAIEGMASIIDEVMRATRLVGINASIIASEAGEQGSRFGVVAERVRSLAGETREGIDQINKLVASVQADIVKVVDAVARGQEIIQAGEKSSTEAGVRLRAIIENSEEADQTTAEITHATRSQAEHVRVVLGALDEVRKATGHIERAVEKQRQTQRQMGAAIHQVRSVGDEVHEATHAQQTQSQAMTSGVRAMTAQFLAIAGSIEAQSRDRDRIEASLEVFEGAARSSVERARQLGEVVNLLRDRLDQLEQELAAFRVE